jgi:hypothetical protein
LIGAAAGAWAAVRDAFGAGDDCAASPPVKKHASAIAPANRVSVVMSSLLMWRGQREAVLDPGGSARVSIRKANDGPAREHATGETRKLRTGCQLRRAGAAGHGMKRARTRRE